jgi:hypothetical protein
MLRRINEYLEKAAECDQLAEAAVSTSLRRRYADLADCYRLLAEECERLAGESPEPGNKSGGLRSS